MKKTVEMYKGVEITESCGYFYPSVNGNVECKTVKEVRKWIDEIYLFCVAGVSVAFPEFNPHVILQLGNMRTLSDLTSGKYL